MAFAQYLARLPWFDVTYALRQWIRVFWTLRSRIDVAARMFYVFIPTTGNLLVVTSAVTLFVHWPLSAELMATAPYYFAASRDQKCLGYDRMDHHAFPKPAIICVVDAQGRATDYAGVTRDRPCVAASDF